jgi:hypothetical protein
MILAHFHPPYVLGMVAILVSVFAALVEIESIMLSGPLLTVWGVWCAIVGGRSTPTNVPGVIFGLSAPLISLFCFLLINGLQWSPRDAEWPIGFIALGYQALMVPMGGVAVLHSRGSGAEGERFRRPQFSLLSLVLAAVFVTVALALVKRFESLFLAWPLPFATTWLALSPAGKRVQKQGSETDIKG